MSEFFSSDNSSPEAHPIACESLHSSFPASNQPSQSECPQDRSARLRSLDTDDHASPTSHPPPPSACPASDESSLDDDTHPQHQSPPPSSDDEHCAHLSDEDFSPATFAHGESQLMSGPQCGLRASAVTSVSPSSSSSEDTNSYSSASSSGSSASSSEPEFHDPSSSPRASSSDVELPALSPNHPSSSSSSDDEGSLPVDFPPSLSLSRAPAPQAVFEALTSPPSTGPALAEDFNAGSSNPTLISPKKKTGSHKHAKKHLTSATPHNTPTTAAGKCRHSRSKNQPRTTAALVEATKPSPAHGNGEAATPSQQKSRSRSKKSSATGDEEAPKRHKKETEKKADKKPSKKRISRIEAPEASDPVASSVPQNKLWSSHGPSETSMMQPRQSAGNVNPKKAKAKKHPSAKCFSAPLGFPSSVQPTQDAEPNAEQTTDGGLGPPSSDPADVKKPSASKRVKVRARRERSGPVHSTLSDKVMFDPTGRTLRPGSVIVLINNTIDDSKSRSLPVSPQLSPRSAELTNAAHDGSISPPPESETRAQDTQRSPSDRNIRSAVAKMKAGPSRQLETTPSVDSIPPRKKSPSAKRSTLGDALSSSPAAPKQKSRPAFSRLGLIDLSETLASKPPRSHRAMRSTSSPHSHQDPTSVASRQLEESSFADGTATSRRRRKYSTSKGSRLLLGEHTLHFSAGDVILSSASTKAIVHGKALASMLTLPSFTQVLFNKIATTPSLHPVAVARQLNFAGLIACLWGSELLTSLLSCTLTLEFRDGKRISKELFLRETSPATILGNGVLFLCGHTFLENLLGNIFNGFIKNPRLLYQHPDSMSVALKRIAIRFFEAVNSLPHAVAYIIVEYSRQLIKWSSEPLSDLDAIQRVVAALIFLRWLCPFVLLYMNPIVDAAPAAERADCRKNFLALIKGLQGIASVGADRGELPAADSILAELAPAFECFCRGLYKSFQKNRPPTTVPIPADHFNLCLTSFFEYLGSNKETFIQLSKSTQPEALHHRFVEIIST